MKLIFFSRNKKTGCVFRIKVFPPRIELRTFSVLGRRDNHYTMETETSFEPDLNQWPMDITCHEFYSPPLYQLSYRRAYLCNAGTLIDSFTSWEKRLNWNIEQYGFVFNCSSHRQHASIAQPAARESHNLEVVSSILTWGNCDHPWKNCKNSG